MARRIVIEDADTSGRVKLASAEDGKRAASRWELQDTLVVCCVGFLEAAAVVIWWPSALVLAGLLCGGFAITIERAKKKLARGGGVDKEAES
jgi:hypothetical protein